MKHSWMLAGKLLMRSNQCVHSEVQLSSILLALTKTSIKLPSHELMGCLQVVCNDNKEMHVLGHLELRNCYFQHSITSAEIWAALFSALKCIYATLISNGNLNDFEQTDQNASVPGASSLEWVVSKILCYSSAVGLMRSCVNEGAMNS